MGFIEMLRYAHVKTNVCGQLLTRRDRVPLAITPDYAPFKSAFGAEGVEALQQPYAERCLARPARTAHQTRERMPEFQIIAHGWSGCNTARTPLLSLFIPERYGCIVSQSASLQESNSVHLIFGLCDYRHCPPLQFSYV
jgi:hypothetical protein